MKLQVKCSCCNEFFPSAQVRNDGGKDYCFMCYDKITGGKREKVKGQRLDVVCAACGKVLEADDPKVHDIADYCASCYDIAKVRRERDPKTLQAREKVKCPVCGRELTPYDIKIHDGVDYCEKCHARVRNASDSVTRAMFGIPSPPEKKAPPEEIDFEEIARIFKSISDPCRLKIIEMLGHKELCVFEFIEITGFQYSAVSYHLKMLKDIGIVYSFRRGNFQVYLLTNKGEVVCDIIKASRALTSI